MALLERLAELAMEGASFEIALAEREAGPSGADAVEFLIAPNAGVPAGPLREIASGDTLSGVLAVFLAVFVGSVMIAATDAGVRDTLGYITARPSDFFSALWEAISGAYSAMFRGAVFGDDDLDAVLDRGQEETARVLEVNQA